MRHSMRQAFFRDIYRLKWELRYIPTHGSLHANASRSISRQVHWVQFHPLRVQLHRSGASLCAICEAKSWTSPSLLPCLVDFIANGFAVCTPWGFRLATGLSPERKAKRSCMLHRGVTSLLFRRARSLRCWLSPSMMIEQGSTLKKNPN